MKPLIKSVDTFIRQHPGATVSVAVALAVAIAIWLIFAGPLRRR
jgi:hypothetical protein